MTDEKRAYLRTLFFYPFRQYYPRMVPILPEGDYGVFAKTVILYYAGQGLSTTCPANSFRFFPVILSGEANSPPPQKLCPPGQLIPKRAQ